MRVARCCAARVAGWRGWRGLLGCWVARVAGWLCGWVAGWRGMLGGGGGALCLLGARADSVRVGVETEEQRVVGHRARESMDSSKDGQRRKAVRVAVEGREEVPVGEWRCDMYVNGCAA
jgi:hypothetical protein